MESLQNDLQYHVSEIIIDARKVVPQHRERIYIVGFNQANSFKFPELSDMKMKLRDILEDYVDNKYTLTDHLWKYLQNYAAKHKAAGNGFGYGLANLKYRLLGP